MATIEESVEWLRRRGYRIVKTDSSYWYDAAPKVYQSFPYHLVITPIQEELDQLFAQTKAIGLRYSTPVDQPEGKISYHVVREKDDCDYYRLPKKARHDITKGRDYAEYRPITLQQLSEEGWGLREETLIRQGRKGAESKDFWNKLCLSAVGLSAFEAYGALHDGVLVASLLACTIGDTVSIYYQQSLTEHLKFGINNTLAFEFTRQIFTRPHIKSIFYGLHSLDAPPTVDEFKFRMGYSPKPVRQRVVINPRLQPLVNPFTYSIVNSIKNIHSQNSRISKVEGLMRFYLQGKLCLAEQNWPEVLKEKV